MIPRDLKTIKMYRRALKVQIHSSLINHRALHQVVLVMRADVLMKNSHLVAREEKDAVESRMTLKKLNPQYERKLVKANRTTTNHSTPYGTKKKKKFTFKQLGISDRISMTSKKDFPIRLLPR